MLKYKTIYEVNAARRRLSGDRYGTRHWYGESEKNRDTDRLTLFTFGEQAQQDSENNLGHCLSVARQYDASLLVFKPQQIQIAGGRVFEPEAAGTALFPVHWCKQYEDWVDTSTPQRPTPQSSEYGSSTEFWIYRNCFALKQHQGVYDVATGKRLTNRREIIERIWDLGFATQRGRPPGIARIRWTGSRGELEEITELADRHWARQYVSEAAKKMVTPFRSINRYAAWPGAW